MHIQLHSQAPNQGRKGKLPLPFLKIEKSILIFEKKALIVSIFGLNYSKSSFKGIQEKKDQNVSPYFSFGAVFDKIFIEVRQCLLSNLYSDLMLCTASDTFRILACIGVFKAYSGLFRHIQHPVERSHIHKLAIY